MASIKHLKRDLNYVMGDIIDAAYIHQLVNSSVDQQKVTSIVNEAIATYDSLIVKINDRSPKNRAKHLKGVNVELEQKATDLVNKVNTL